MLLFFIKIYFFAIFITMPSLQAATEQADQELSADSATPEDYQLAPIEEAAIPTPAAITPTTDQSAAVQNSQLKWPDTSELDETITNIVPANATTTINLIFDKAQQSITSMDTAIKEMLQKRSSLYADFFTQSTTSDDFMQDRQVETGALIELFSPSDK